MSHDVIVIGAGVNGLVAATLLARNGRKVIVLERRETIGGVCVTEEFAPGFRANTCIDDPGWMPDALARDLDLGRYGYETVLSPVGAVFPTVAGPIVLTDDVADAGNALRALSPRDGSRWDAFCQQVSQLSRMLGVLSEKPAPVPDDTSLRGLWALAMSGRAMRGLGRRGMVDFLRSIPMPVSDYLDDWFESEALKGALAFSGVRHVQHGPLSGGTTLVFLHHHMGLKRGLIGGRRLPRGGVGLLPTALAEAARAAGVEIRTDSEVQQIVVRQDHTRGVALADGQELLAPVVLSSVDVRATFTRLVDPGWMDPEFLHATDHVRMRSPVVRMHLALDTLPAFVTGGRPWAAAAMRGVITIAPTMHDLEHAYDAAKHGGIADAPCLEITIPSVDDPSLAPAGRHVMTVHVQYAAHDLRGGWSRERTDVLARTVVQRIGDHAPGFEQSIAHLEILSPVDIAARYAVSEGSVLHGELALDQFLFMRPVPDCARYATPLPGLWLCGSSTHPGAGTAGISGALAARAVVHVEKRR